MSPEENNDIFFYEAKLTSLYYYYDFGADELYYLYEKDNLPENEKFVEMLRNYNNGHEFDDYFLIFYDCEHKPISSAHHVLHIDNATYLNGNETNDTEEDVCFTRRCIRVIEKVIYNYLRYGIKMQCNDK